MSDRKDDKKTLKIVLGVLLVLALAGALTADTAKDAIKEISGGLYFLIEDQISEAVKNQSVSIAPVSGGGGTSYLTSGDINETDDWYLNGSRQITGNITMNISGQIINQWWNASGNEFVIEVE